MEFLGIDANTIDPNIIYIWLVFSLWVAVSAVFVPGTGVLETVALLGVGMALAVLMDMQVHWTAILLLISGVAVFSLLPFINPKYARWALLGLAVQGIASLFVFEDQTVHPLVILLALLIPLAYYEVVLLPMLKNLKEQPAASREDAVIGAIGRVTRDIDPVGTVHVNSESWTATSSQKLKTGAKIEVTDRKGLQLVVKGIKEKRREEFVTTDTENGVAEQDLNIS